MSLHKKVLFVIIAQVMLLFSANAQSSFETAKSLKVDFPDESIILNDSYTKIEFINKRNDLSAVEQVKESFIAITSNAAFKYAVVYDDNSSVTKFDAGNYMWIKDRAYSTEDIFHSDLRMKYVDKTIPFGKKIDLEFEKVFSDLKYFTKINFCGLYTSLNKKVEIIVPKNIDVKLVEKNFDGYDIEFDSREKGSSTIYTYNIKNIEGFTKESNAPGSSYIYPHVLIIVKSYQDNKDIKRTLFESTDDLYAWYKTLVDEIDNQPEILTSIVASLVEGKNTNEEKIEAIYYWVQDNIRYLAFEEGIAGYKPENCQSVFENRYGDCKGMSNLMKEMLKIAGIDARLAWLGTKLIAYDYSMPSLASDNHMICAVKQGDDYLFIDPTEKYISIYEYAERIQGKEALVENGNEYSIIKVPEKTNKQNKRVIEMNLSLNDDLNLTGQLYYSLEGETKSHFIYGVRNTASNLKESVIKTYLSQSEENIVITNIVITGDAQNDKITEIKSDIAIDNVVSSFDDETYLYIDPYKLYNNFKLEDDRKFDYWFDYKILDQLKIKLSLPKGWKVTSIPDGINIHRDQFMFDVDYNQQEDTIDYTVRIEIPEAEVTINNKEEWNLAIEKLKNIYENPIILKRI